MSRPSFYLYVAWIAVFLLAHRVSSHEVPSLIYHHILEFQTSKLVINAKTDQIFFGESRLNTPSMIIDAKAMTLHLETGVLILIHPRLALTNAKIRFSSQRLVLFANSQTLRLENVHLHIEDTKIDVNAAYGSCTKSACRLRDISGSSCPHTPRGFAVSASEMHLHQSGDIDIQMPTFELNRRPIFSLPWIRIRPRHKPAFTFPKLGYDAKDGLIAGPAGFIPLSEHQWFTGHIALRSNQGFETRTTFYSPDLHLAVNHLYDYPRNLLNLKADASPELKNAAANLHLDFVTHDKTIIDNVSTTHDQRAITHTSSRALLSKTVRNAIFESAFEWHQPFDSQGDLSYTALTPIGILSLFVPRFSIFEHLSASMQLQVVRRGFDSSGVGLDTASRLTPFHSRLEASPIIGSTFHIGPVRADIQTASRHQIWLIDGETTKLPYIHAISSQIELSLPLYRNFSAIRHTVSPYSRYRITPFLDGNSPYFVADRLDAIKRGQAMEFGVSTTLENSDRHTIARLDLYDKFHLKGLSAPPNNYFAIRGYLGPNWLQFSFDSAIDHHRATPSVLGGTFTNSNVNGHSLKIGVRWLGPGNGPHREPSFFSASSPWLSSLFLPPSSKHIEIYSDTHVPLSQRATLFLGARMGLHPSLILHMAWYGFNLKSTCGCFSFTVTASHRHSNPIPDVMTSLTIKQL